MGAPTNQHALREALARVLASFDKNSLEDRAVYLAEADALIAGPLASLLAERDAAVADGATLAANQCEGPMIGDEWGHFHCASLIAAEAENTRLKETVEAARAALKPFAEAWDSVEEISEQGAGYVQDTDNAWVSGNASGGSYPLFKFGDLRAARSVLATIPPKENPDA